MSALPKKHWTAEEYLAFERSSEERHELINGEIYLMSGASRNHNVITLNIGGSLNTQLSQRSCEAYANDMRVRVRERNYLYPDVVAVCGEPQLEDDQVDTLLNPTVIIEVLSPSTEIYDRVKKFQLYLTLNSMQEYILISQDIPRVEHYIRQPNGQWFYEQITNLESQLELPSINCTVPLATIYNKITFEES